MTCLAATKHWQPVTPQPQTQKKRGSWRILKVNSMKHINSVSRQPAVWSHDDDGGYFGYKWCLYFWAWGDHEAILFYDDMDITVCLLIPCIRYPCMSACICMQMHACMFVLFLACRHASTIATSLPASGTAARYVRNSSWHKHQQ